MSCKEEYIGDLPTLGSLMGTEYAIVDDGTTTYKTLVSNFGGSVSWTSITGSQSAINLSGFNNDSGFIANVTGLLTAGSNITITGSGTSGSPYNISSSGGGGGTPGGSATQLQYNNSGSFGGILGSSVNTTTRTTGFNQATPLASVHAGTYSQTFPAPSGSTATANTVPNTTGYPFSAASITYNAYAGGSINGVTTYSSSYDTFAATAPTATNFDATSSSCGINISGLGYTENNDYFQYNIYALYGSNISVNSTQCNYGPTSSSGNSFSNSISWNAPVNTTGLTGYVIVRNWSVLEGDYYQVLGTGTSFNDDGTGWNGGDPSNPQILWNANLSIGSVGGVSNYITYNTNYGTWIDTGGTPNFTDSNDFPNSGSPTVTPNSYKYPSAFTDGETRLVTDGVSVFSVFNGSGSNGPLAGDMVQGWQQFGFGTSPFVQATSVQYENGQPLESAHAIYDYAGNYVIDSGGGLTANTGFYSPMGTGVDSNGKATWNGVKDTTLTAETPVFTNSTKQLISLNNPLMQQVFGF